MTLLVTAAACATSDELDVKDANTGTIVARFNRNGSAELQSIHVKGSVNDNCGVIYTINSKTTIQSRDAAGKVRSASVAELVVGASVHVWAPYELESCPAQATATAVELIQNP